MKSVDAVAVQGAVLPFVRAWKDLDEELVVVSLDTDGDDWSTILAGQGIALRSETLIPPNCAVATGFDTLNTLSSETLRQWAVEQVKCLRPGGLLILGGVNPKHPNAHKTTLFPDEAANILKASGFARVQVVRPCLKTGDQSLAAAIYGMGREYAVVAQRDAYGKDFDVFSMVFADAAAQSRQVQLKHAEAHLHARFNADLERVHTHLTGLEITLNHSADIAADLAHRQTEEITRLKADIATLQTQLSELQTKLQHATRRRGLRKLAHELKKKLRPNSRKTASSAAITPKTFTPALEPLEAQAVKTPPPLSTGQAKPCPIDPVPLSPREVETRSRLFGSTSE